MAAENGLHAAAMINPDQPLADAWRNPLGFDGERGRERVELSPAAVGARALLERSARCRRTACISGEMGKRSRVCSCAFTGAERRSYMWEGSSALKRIRAAC